MVQVQVAIIPSSSPESHNQRLQLVLSSPASHHRHRHHHHHHHHHPFYPLQIQSQLELQSTSTSTFIVPYLSRDMFPLRFVYFIPSRPRNHNQNQNRNHNHRNANANADVNHHEVEFLNIQLHLDTIRSYDNDSDTSTRNNDNDNTRRKRQRTATGLNLNLSLNNTSTAKDKNARKSDTNSDTINANTNISTMDMTISFSRVSDSYGLLEYILSYSPPQDLLCAAQVNRQWYHCARQDNLWRQACIYLWRDKVGMPLLRRGDSIALFWRSFWDVSAVLGSRSGSGTRSPSGSDPYLNLNSESRSRSGSGPVPGLDVNSNGDLGIGNTARMAMRVKDMRGLFTERPLGRRAVRDLFSACLEKSDMQRAILDLMPDELGLEVDHSKDGSNAAQHKYRNLQERMHGNRNGHEHGHGKVLRKGFDRLWFGSYASSIIDSRRTVMTLDELLSRRGFLMHFKVFHHSHDYNGEIRGTRTQGPEEISLHYHCVCYFDEATAAATMSQSDGSRDGSSEREGGQGGFRMDESRDNDMHHPQDLSWHWIHAGRTVQVGQYPPLVLHRRPNWGWKLENHHVVLYSQ